MDNLQGGGLEKAIVNSMDYRSIAMILSGTYPLQPEIDTSKFYGLLAKRLNEENERDGPTLLDKGGNPVCLKVQELMRIKELYLRFNRAIEQSDPDYAKQGMLIVNFMMTAPKLPPQISAALWEHLQPIQARIHELTEFYVQQR